MLKNSLLEKKVYRVLEGVAQDKVVGAFSSRFFKNMSLSYADTACSLADRDNFLSKLGIDYRDLVCAKQTHSSRVKYVTEEELGRGADSYDTSIPDTDALITDKKNLPLSVFTADCLSIFIYDAATPAIGLVHAGWRSSREGITVKALESMREKFSSSPQNIYACFGPSIRPCCYEVGEEFRDFFHFGLAKRNRRYYLDLVQVNRKQMLDSGMKEASIFDTDICTCCQSEEFFSYRREGASCGRMISVAMLK